MSFPVLQMAAFILAVLRAPIQSIALPSPENNLALGRPCTFAPKPNCSDTAPGDETDLTDGKCSKRTDSRIWSDPASVSWEYTPRLNIQVDLGAEAVISEIGARFLGGSPQPSLDFPTYVTAVASLDGEHWFQVASYDSHRWSDDVAFGVPQSTGKAWVHPLRFQGLSFRARYVGWVVGGTGLTCSDEVWVLGAKEVRGDLRTSPGPSVEFSTTRPQIAGIRESITLGEGLTLPQQLLLLDESLSSRTVRLSISLPRGILFGALN